jgi:hypothetical protein
MRMKCREEREWTLRRICRGESYCKGTVFVFCFQSQDIRESFMTEQGTDKMPLKKVIPEN